MSMTTTIRYYFFDYIWKKGVRKGKCQLHSSAFFDSFPTLIFNETKIDIAFLVSTSSSHNSSGSSIRQVFNLKIKHNSLLLIVLYMLFI